MTNQLNNLSLKQKIFVFNYVNDEMQIKRKDGKLYLYDAPVDLLLKEINVAYINKYYNELLKNSDKNIIKDILANYNKFNKN